MRLCEDWYAFLCCGITVAERDKINTEFSKLGGEDPEGRIEVASREIELALDRQHE